MVVFFSVRERMGFGAFGSFLVLRAKRVVELLGFVSLLMVRWVRVKGVRRIFFRVFCVS